MAGEKYQYSALAQKYGGFLQPALLFQVGGEEVARSGKLPVQEISVSLSCEEASTCRATLLAEYDHEKSSFAGAQTDVIGLGKKVSVQLGYGSACTEVFRGYVTEIEYLYNTSPQISVTMMDLRKLMMDSKRVRQMSVKAPSEAVRDVLETYSSLYDSAAIQADQQEQEPFQIKQNRESDYDFVQRLAQGTGKEFYVFAGKVYYEERSRNPDLLITLAPQGGGILSFSSRITYIDKQFTVIGRKKDSKEQIIRTRSYRSEFVKESVLSSMAPIVHESPSIQTEAAAEKWLDDAIKKEKEKGLEASVQCIGLPEFIPGRYLACENIGTPFDRKYFIESVEHSFGSGGFTTELTLSG